MAGADPLDMANMIPMNDLGFDDILQDVLQEKKEPEASYVASWERFCFNYIEHENYMIEDIFYRPDSDEEDLEDDLDDGFDVEEFVDEIIKQKGMGNGNENDENPNADDDLVYQVSENVKHDEVTRPENEENKDSSEKRKDINVSHTLQKEEKEQHLADTGGNPEMDGKEAVGEFEQNDNDNEEDWETISNEDESENESEDDLEDMRISDIKIERMAKVLQRLRERLGVPVKTVVPAEPKEFDPTEFDISIRNHIFLGSCSTNEEDYEVLVKLMDAGGLNYKDSPCMVVLERDRSRGDPDKDERAKALIMRMLDEGADINLVHWGETLLMVAFKFHSKPLVELLLSDPLRDKLDVNILDEHMNASPLFHAIRWRSESYASKENEEPWSKDPMPVSYIKTLVDMGCSLDHCDALNFQPLDVAIIKQDFECVELLLECGAPIRTTAGPTHRIYVQAPLVKCAHYDMAKMAKILLRSGGILDFCEYKYEKPTLVALMRLNINVLKVFIESGADFSQEWYLFEDQSPEDVYPPIEIFDKRPDFKRKLIELAETPVSLQRQCRKALWKCFSLKKISLRKIYNVDIPKVLADYVYFK